MEEEALVLTLFSSFSSVFREAGTPVDVNNVAKMMRKAVVSRGLTKPTRRRLVDAIQTLSKFSVGFLTVVELEDELGVRGEAQDAAAKVYTVAEVLQLATSLHNFSRKQAERANKQQAMQANQAEESTSLAQSSTTDTSIKECVLPERCTTPVWEKQDESAARSFDSGTYEHPTPPPSPPHPSSEHTITTSLSTMTSLSDYSSASSSQDSGSELSSPTGDAPKPFFKTDAFPDKVAKLLKSNIKMKQIEDASKLTLEIDVPPHKVAKLLKSNMQQIEAISGATLTLYRETAEKVLMVTGNQRQCTEARMMVLKKINEPDYQRGALYRIPYGFLNQPKDLEAQLAEIGFVNNCELRAVRDVNTGLGFIFINGSMQADVQCCIQALQEWENTFLQQRTSSRGTRIIDANTPSPSATGVSRVKYSREELISLCSFNTPVPKFTAFAENLGIVNIQPKSPLTPTTPTVFFQSPVTSRFQSPAKPKAKTKFWNEKMTRADVADKWEHDLFDPAF